LVAAPADRLPSSSQAIEVAFRNVAALDDSIRADILVHKVDDRENDTDGKNDAQNVERNRRLHLRGPTVEDEEVDRCKHVDDVHGDRDEKEETEVAVGELGTATTGLEVVEVDVLPLGIRQLLDLLLAMTEATHFEGIGMPNPLEKNQRIDDKQKKKRKRMSRGYRNERERFAGLPSVPIDTSPAKERC
jgi:hypothetical protein